MCTSINAWLRDILTHTQLFIPINKICLPRWGLKIPTGLWGQANNVCMQRFLMFSCTCTLTLARSLMSMAMRYIMISYSEHNFLDLHSTICSSSATLHTAVCVINVWWRRVCQTVIPIHHLFFLMRKPCDFTYTGLHVTLAAVSCKDVFGILEVIASCRCNILAADVYEHYSENNLYKCLFFLA